MSKYLLDANVFIQAKNREYAMDFCPGFWEWLDRMNLGGKIFSIAAIADELTPAGDEVSTWVKARQPQFFLPHTSDAPMLAALPTISSWATSKSYPSASIAEFLGCADYFLIGYARANGYTVVTHEIHQPAAKKIKIPTACHDLGIPCITPYQLLRSENAKFLMATSAPCNCNGHS